MFQALGGLWFDGTTNFKHSEKLVASNQLFTSLSKHGDVRHKCNYHQNGHPSTQNHAADCLTLVITSKARQYSTSTSSLSNDHKCNDLDPLMRFFYCRLYERWCSHCFRLDGWYLRISHNREQWGTPWKRLSIYHLSFAGRGAKHPGIQNASFKYVHAWCKYFYIFLFLQSRQLPRCEGILYFLKWQTNHYLIFFRLTLLGVNSTIPTTSRKFVVLRHRPKLFNE